MTSIYTVEEKLIVFIMLFAFTTIGLIVGYQYGHAEQPQTNLKELTCTSEQSISLPNGLDCSECMPRCSQILDESFQVYMKVRNFNKDTQLQEQIKNR